MKQPKGVRAFAANRCRAAFAFLLRLVTTEVKIASIFTGTVTRSSTGTPEYLLRDCREGGEKLDKTIANNSYTS
jgi:hypothetical protein